MTTETKIEFGVAQPPVKAVKKKKRGPGRPAKSVSQRIRELDRAGFTPKQIAAKTGSSVQMVYVVRHTEKKKQELASTARAVKTSPDLYANFAPAPVKTEGAQIPYIPYDPTPFWQPSKPTFWQRVKAVFFPN